MTTLEEVAAAGERVARAEAVVKDAMTDRNALVADLLSQGERAMTIAIALGVTPARVYQMRDQAKR